MFYSPLKGYVSLVKNAWHTFLSEPQQNEKSPLFSVANLLTPLVAMASVYEFFAQSESRFRPLYLVIGLALALALLFSKKRPFRAFIFAFTLVQAATLLSILTRTFEPGFHSFAIILVFVYALFRRGSGKQCLIAFASMSFTMLLSQLNHETQNLSDAIGGALVLLFPAAIGLTLRYRAQSVARELENVRLEERNALARDLHDSVGHRMSAIAILAQAARAAPDAAQDALKSIEDEATKTLDELRVLVGGLREDGAPMAPQESFDSLARLVENAEHARLEKSGELNGVTQAVQSAVYRIVQESLTNVQRHAKDASEVVVGLHAERSMLTLTVTDNGHAPRAFEKGFGLRGMRERVELLGGHFRAGPIEKGWQVRAEFQR